MVIRRLKIETFGMVERYETNVYADVLTVFGRCGEMLAAAVRALCGMSLTARERRWLRADSLLQADLDGKRAYRVTLTGTAPTLQVTDRQSGEDCTEAYRRATACSAAEEQMLCFGRQSSRHCPDLLCRYLSSLPAEDADGIGRTATFHRAVKRYVRDFEEERLRPDKPLCLTLADNGRFAVRRESCPWEEVALSETEAVLFSFLCFLHLRRFWKTVYDAVDMHREDRPIIVREFAEYVDASVPLLPYLHRLRLDAAQMLLIVPCEEDAVRVAGWPSVQALYPTEQKISKNA